MWQVFRVWASFFSFVWFGAIGFGLMVKLEGGTGVICWNWRNLLELDSVISLMPELDSGISLMPELDSGISLVPELECVQY